MSTTRGASRQHGNLDFFFFLLPCEANEQQTADIGSSSAESSSGRKRRRRLDRWAHSEGSEVRRRGGGSGEGGRSGEEARGGSKGEEMGRSAFERGRQQRRVGVALLSPETKSTTFFFFFFGA